MSLDKIKLVKRQGNLNTVVPTNYFSAVLSADAKTLTMSDSTVTYASGITTVRKKVLLLLNVCCADNSIIRQDLVYESTDSFASTWLFSDFPDGWYSNYIFYTETYGGLTPIPTGAARKKDSIIYYVGEGKDGFYRDLTGTGTDLPSTPNTVEWKPAEYSDWITFAKELEQATSRTWKGEYGLHQILLTPALIAKLGELAEQEACALMRDICGCEISEYSKLSTLIAGAHNAFCQLEFLRSKRFLDFALAFLDECENLKCTSC